MVGARCDGDGSWEAQKWLFGKQFRVLSLLFFLLHTKWAAFTYCPRLLGKSMLYCNWLALSFFQNSPDFLVIFDTKTLMEVGWCCANINSNFILENWDIERQKTVLERTWTSHLVRAQLFTDVDPVLYKMRIFYLPVMGWIMFPQIHMLKS